MLKIGLIVASVGGPSRMASLFAQGTAEDSVWLMVQCHADDGALQRLGESLQEITGRRVQVARQTLTLHRGDIILLSNRQNYSFEENRLLLLAPESGPFQLDRLFFTLSELKFPLSALLLTGPSLEGITGTGLKTLLSSGATVLGVDAMGWPASGAIEQAAQQKLVSGFIAARGAVAQAKFTRQVKKVIAE